MTTTPLLTPEEAAHFLNVKARTLEKWRQKRTGPSFHRLGSRCIRYSPKDLQEWLEGISDTHQTTNNDKE